MPCHFLASFAYSPPGESLIWTVCNAKSLSAIIRLCSPFVVLVPYYKDFARQKNDRLSGSFGTLSETIPAKQQKTANRRLWEAYGKALSHQSLAALAWLGEMPK
jgi:hypothetical protein